MALSGISSSNDTLQTAAYAEILQGSQTSVCFLAGTGGGAKNVDVKSSHRRSVQAGSFFLTTGAW